MSTDHTLHCPILEADTKNGDLYSVYATHVAHVYGVTPEDRAAKTEAIKIAVNAHADLVKALKEAQGLAKLAKSLTGCPADDEYVAGVAAVIDAALSKVQP